MINRLLIYLAAILMACPLFGQHVTDKANLLSSADVQRLETALPANVWVETFQSVPSDNIKGYGDTRVAQLSPDHVGFIVVITTHPRAWRISMYPVGAVGGEATRQIGDQMAGGFKRGQFYDALLGAGKNLSALGEGTPFVPPSAAPAVAHPATHTVTTTTSTTHRSAMVQQPYRPVAYRDNSGMVFLWVLLGIVVLFLTIWIISEIIEGIAERRAERARQAARDAYPRYATPPSAQAGQNADPVKAQQMWDGYTPAQRQTVVNQYSSSPYYHGGILSDPLQFYMFMSLMNHGGYGYGAGYYNGYGPGYGGGGYGGGSVAPVREDTTETTTTRTETTQDDSRYEAPSSAPSSYDSGGSSGGFDSGSSSSYDSGSSSSSSDSGSSSSDSGSSFSSSDSGGGGGGW